MKIKTQIKKHAPTALVVGGIATIIGGTVLACKKTVKMKKVVDDTKEEIEGAKAALTTVNPENPEYTEKDCKKDIRKIYTRAAVSTAKTYAIPAGIIFAGSAMVLCGHNILRKRYSALSAAYVTLSSGFEAYRARVRVKIGEDEEYKIYHNIETEVVGEGKKKKELAVIKDASMYDVVFNSSTSDYAHNDAIYNHETQEWEGYDVTLVAKTREVLQNRLESKGRVFLNEAKKDLGMAETRAGQVVGWVYDPSDETRDSHIDIDMYPVMDESGETTLGLAFNVDGPILDYLTD